MNASAVLAQLKAAGVHVAVANGKLELEGPTEVLNEGVLAELRAIKAELIKLLSATEPDATPDTASLIAEWRASIEAVYSTLPDITKLRRASLRFLDSPDAIAAVENGWDAVSLFGVHEGNAPKQRVGCWGLVLFIAWGVHGCTVETVDQKVCALRTRSGAVQTQPRLRANFDQALPWWEHAGIVNTNDGDSHE